MTEYLTLEGVELASVGMAWPAMTGPASITMQHLADAMVAANDDPLIVVPRLKLGHTDPRFNGSEGLDCDPFSYPDGDPAFGRVINLRLENDGAVLVGDYVEVPAWLAEAAPSAYPSRSVEAVWDVQTQGGKRYSMVLTAVALLGAETPAVSDIEDLKRVLSTGSLAAGKGAAMSHVALSASIDQVERAFWADFAVGDRFWWWPRDILVDPNQVLADDDEGGLHRVPFATDEKGNVTFSDPIRVYQQLVDQPETVAASGGAPVTPITVPGNARRRAYATAASARPADRIKPSATPVVAATQADDPRPQTQEGHMDPQEIRNLLGLAEDATDEQVREALAARNDQPEAPEGEPETPETPEAEVDEPETPAVVAPATVAVSQEVYEEQQRRLEALETERTERETVAATQRRDAFADRMVGEGRITPAERALCRSNLDINEDETVKAYSALAKGRVPVDRDRGRGDGLAASGDDALLAATRQRLNIKTPTEA